MQFLSNWTVNVAKIPTYVEFNQEFVENVDYDLANIQVKHLKDNSLKVKEYMNIHNIKNTKKSNP
jgi:hypothetical protein